MKALWRFQTERPAAGRGIRPVASFLTTAVLVGFALAGARPAVAGSDLAYQGAPLFTAPASDDGSWNDGGSSRSVLFTAASERPIRHRRPDAYRTYDYTPHYFASLGVGTFDPSEQPGSGFYFNGTVGSEVYDPIDLGLGLSWYHRSTGGSQVISNYTDPAGNTGQRVVETSSVKTDLVPIMGFLRVRFPTGSSVQPYVGAGIGWEWLTVDGTDSQGFDFRDEYDGFGAQFFGGAQFTVAPNVSVYGEGVYNASTVKDTFYDPTFGGNVRDEIDMNGAALHGGLKFRF
ncbi:MAG TPA: outer membrane beta-barrel protein [Candidatus Eisenbacteria bacterium]